MMRYLVCTIRELPPGSKKIVEAGGRSIGVYNIGGEFHAIRNVCPHQGAPLCTGLTTAWVSSEGPGEFSFECEGGIVRCPWHQWEFDLKTGRMIVDPGMRTMTYDVTVEHYPVSLEDGRIFVEIG